MIFSSNISPDTASKAIGLFDSGVGGLTVLQALWECLPQEEYIYLGDTARLPYGTKSSETIIRYALQASSVLLARNIKLLVVACNTASAVALPALRAAYPQIPIIGVVEPGAIAACNASITKKIAVIATASTTRGGAYVRAIKNIEPQAEIESIACPLFVPLAEDGLIDGHLAEGIAARYLDPYFKQESQEKPDCLVLGCTHFPLLSQAIQNVVGNDVKLVNSAETTAQSVKEILIRSNILNTKEKLKTHFLTTDDVPQFARVGQAFLGVNIPEESVELVDL